MGIARWCREDGGKSSKELGLGCPSRTTFSSFDKYLVVRSAKIDSMKTSMGQGCSSACEFCPVLSFLMSLSYISFCFSGTPILAWMQLFVDLVHQLPAWCLCQAQSPELLPWPKLRCSLEQGLCVSSTGFRYGSNSMLSSPCSLCSGLCSQVMPRSPNLSSGCCFATLHRIPC